MPAHTRSPAGNLPDIDESSHPSPLLSSNFDRATLEATVPFADRSIFVAPNGRRFLFESIPDGSGGGNGKGLEDASRLSPTTPAITPPPRGRAPEPTRASTPKDYSALNSTPIRRRPVSNNSNSPLHSPSARADDTQLRSDSAEPNALAQEVLEMMGDLNINRFSATPFFAHSDGGVQAAETLTDPHPVPGLPIPRSPVSPAVTLARPPLDASAYYHGFYSARTHMEPSYAPQGPVLSGRLTNVNFGFQHTPAADDLPELHQQTSHGSGITHVSTRQSLLEQSMPISPAIPANPIVLSSSGYQTLQSPVGPGYASTIPQIPPPTDYTYSLHNDSRRANGSFSYSIQEDGGGLHPSYSSYNVADDGRGRNRVMSPFDTQTPVVVIEPTLDPSSYSSRSDGASTSRDNVLPGEEVLYDGRVRLAQGLSAPFVDGSLKVFRNTLSGDLRFHCKIGYGSETYWVKGTHAQIVPVYAYDQRFPNVVYVRDNDSEKRNGYAQATQGNGRPSEVYQFARFQELCEFQAKLTGEKVVLDISSVKLVKLSKAHSRSNETFSSVRVQIWHEEEARRSSQSDVASFVTAGTTLSGPLRDRLVPSTSRLMVYLGRLDEYITTFITDDIEVVAEGQTMVKIKPRKGGSVFKRSGSRWAGVKAHREAKKGAEPAGLDIRCQSTDPDTISSFDLYETFEIEFESSPSQDNFIRKWEEVMKARRLQRKALEKINEEIRHATFSAKTAREIW